MTLRRSVLVPLLLILLLCVIYYSFLRHVPELYRTPDPLNLEMESMELTKKDQRHELFQLPTPTLMPELCQMDSCFEFSRCSLHSGFPVYFYTAEELSSLSKEYVVAPIKDGWSQKTYGTRDPGRACMFVVVLGEVTRDQYSPHDLEAGLRALPHWNEGRNHLLISLSPNLNTNAFLKGYTGRAVLAHPTFLTNFRQNYDIVVPPSPRIVTGNLWRQLPPLFPAQRKYLVSFWGQYVPAQERNDHVDQLKNAFMAALKILEGMHSGIDYVSVVNLSCGTRMSSAWPSDWALCGTEEDRQTLLSQSTFTLLLPPLNPSLTSTVTFLTRLREALKHGAVPVLMGHTRNRLPFADILRWEDASVSLPSPRVHDLLPILRSFADGDVLEYRRRGRFLWETYFSSSEQILEATLTVLRSRLRIPAAPVKDTPTLDILDDSKLSANIDVQRPNSNEGSSSAKFQRNFTYALEMRMLNNPGYPFALLPSTPFEPVLPSDFMFKDKTTESPRRFGILLGRNHPQEQFTVMILTFKRETSLMAVLNRLKGLPCLNKVLVVWNDPAPPSPTLPWPQIGVPLVVTRGVGNSLNNRFLPFDVIETDCIFSLDDDVVLSQKDIISGFRIWQGERDRIVGFFTRSHAFDRKRGQWKYVMTNKKGASIMITSASFFHKYYLYLYTYTMPQSIRDHVEKKMNCEDIAMNFLIAHVTRKAPIRVASNYHQVCPGCRGKISTAKNHAAERDGCMNVFAGVYGYMPLLVSPFTAGPTFVYE